MKLIILICTIVSQPFSWTILSGDDLVSRKYIYLFILNLSPIPHPDPSHNLVPFDFDIELCQRTTQINLKDPNTPDSCFIIPPKRFDTAQAY